MNQWWETAGILALLILAVVFLLALIRVLDLVIPLQPQAIHVYITKGA